MLEEKEESDLTAEENMAVEAVSLTMVLRIRTASGAYEALIYQLDKV